MDFDFAMAIVPIPMSLMGKNGCKYIIKIYHAKGFRLLLTGRERVHPTKAKEAQEYRAWCKARKATNKKACEDYHKSVGNRLVDYLPLIGIKVSTAHAPGKQTKRINDILSGLKRTKGDYAGLTRTQKAKWTKLLNHNELDVKGLRTLLRRVHPTICSMANMT